MGVGCRSRTSGNPVACIQRNDRTSLASKLPWPDDGLALGPAVYQLMFGGQIRPDEVEPEQQAAAKDSFAALADIFQPDGAPYSETTTLRTHLVWAMVHGIASLRINGFLSNQSEGLDEITKSACRVLSKDWFRTGRSGR
jgi:hypothetical protein